jgi:hypothetical protein
VAGFEARAFRGCGVFTSEPFEVSDDSDSVQMLTRSSQIGEFYIMMPPQVKPTGGAGSNLHTADMLIYDEESDKHVRITWRQALDATLASRLSNDCRVSKGHSGSIGVNAGEAQGKKTWMELAEAVAQYSSGKDAKGVTVEVADDAWQTLSDDGALDIRIVVARPFIEHLMVRCSSPFAPLPARARLTPPPPFGAAQRHPRGVGPRDGRDALRPGGHAVERQHPGQDHRGCASRPHARSSLRPWPFPPPAAERATRGAQATTRATSRP